VEDMGSTNGTVVNGTAVRSAKLVQGDRIQLGPDLVLQFALYDDTEETLARKLFEASTRDPLTGVYNRRYFFERLDAETAHARRHSSPLSVLLIDVDDMKELNELHGHRGDEILRAVAKALSETTRSHEVLCRHGGEQFALLVREPLDRATRLAERLRSAVESIRIPVGKKTLELTVSIGVAEVGERGAQLTTDGLVRVADKRLQRSKSLGRNRITSQ